ncbi:MAG: retroviral-like aspartic protease family protein [Candidatus Thermoplasmatota archaeon]
MPSFTTQVPNLQELGPIVETRIIVGKVLEDILKRDSKSIPNPMPIHAMIDTGATRTVVREDLVKQLGLNPVGVTSITTPSSTNVQCYEYLIRLILPNHITIETVAIAAQLVGQHINV